MQLKLKEVTLPFETIYDVFNNLAPKQILNINPTTKQLLRRVNFLNSAISISKNL